MTCHPTVDPLSWTPSTALCLFPLSAVLAQVQDLDSYKEGLWLRIQGLGFRGCCPRPGCLQKVKSRLRVLFHGRGIVPCSTQNLNKSRLRVLIP